MTAEPGVNWGEFWAAAGVIFTVMSGLILAGIAHLKSVLRATVHESEIRITGSVERRFSTKEVVELLVSDIHRRLADVERKSFDRRREEA